MENLASGFTWSDPVDIDEDMTLVLTVGIVDANRDGRPDIIACESEGIDLAWFENTGSGDEISFARDNIGIYHAHDMIVVEDGFGYSDDVAVIMTDELGGTVDLLYVFPGSDPTGLWGRDVITDEYPNGPESGICILDYNGDGMRDIAATSVADHSMRVYLSAPGDRDSIEWSPANIVTGYAGLTDVGCGDFNGDGRTDLATVTNPGTDADRVSWWPNTE